MQHCHELQTDSNIYHTKIQFRKYSDKVLCHAINLNKTDTSIFKMLSTRQQWLDAHALLQHQEGFAKLICQTQCWKPEKLRISGDVMHKRNFFIFNNQIRVFLMWSTPAIYSYTYSICIPRPFFPPHSVCSELTIMLLVYSLQSITLPTKFLN